MRKLLREERGAKGSWGLKFKLKAYQDVESGWLWGMGTIQDEDVSCQLW